MADGHKIILHGASQKENAHRLIEQAPTGYVLTISEPTRTLEQNDKFWAMLTDLSIAKPEGRKGTPDDWKHWVMHTCGFECQFMEGLDGRPFPIGFRSSKLKVKQMIDLMDWMYAYGAEHGVIWSEPKQEDAA